MTEIFLISSSRFSGANGIFLAHCLDSLSVFLGQAVAGRNKIVFIPYADPDGKYETYTKTVAEAFLKIGYEVISLHTKLHPAETISDPAVVAIFIGGGNTWLLQNNLYEEGLLGIIREYVLSGRKKYIGSSAGTVVACPTILTTNDMPPVYPSTERSLGLIPFQINPHFIPGKLVPKHQGEPREERIRQFLNFNLGSQVVGLPEGCWIEGKGYEYILRGTGKATIFRNTGGNSIWLPGEPFDKEGML